MAKLDFGKVHNIKYQENKGDEWKSIIVPLNDIADFLDNIDPYDFEIDDEELMRKFKGK